jgi:hypothetical protein
MSNKQPGQVHQEHTPQTGQTHGHPHQVQERERHDRSHLGHESRPAGFVNAHENHTPAGQPHAANEKPGITIYIDRQPYRAANDTFTGAELRRLAVPPLGADKNIFRVVSGKGDDVQVGENDRITVDMRAAHQGRHFFSDTIVPSKDEVARRAYYIYQQEGCQPGHDAENWAKAEAQLDSHS